MWNSTIPENDATFMLFLSNGVCCPGFPLIVTRGKPLQLSGPRSDNAWFNSSLEPIRWANEPRDPNSCSQFLISQWREQRFALLRSSSRRNWRSSRKPVDLLSRLFFNIKLLVARWMQFVQNWDHALKVPRKRTFKYSKIHKDLRQAFWYPILVINITHPNLIHFT